ncbi:MAG: DNA alkylation repair protein [Candidatus Latescibacterota bacterium]|nr:MAG: DNA alkylation repair protein [Candidatus Latescibacterota bacterium]
MTRRPAVDPAKKADGTVRLLRSLADPEVARSGQRFFKEPVPLLGIPGPTINRVARELVRETRGCWTAREAVRFCDVLVREPHLEARAVGFLAVAPHAGDAGPFLLARIRSWLARSCGSWAAVDTLAPRVLGPFVDRHPDRIPEVVEWTGAKNMWVRRGAAVAFVNHARKGRHLGAAYEIAERLLDDEEDLMHKAVGWLLREAGKADGPRLERFLRRHGPRIPRTTLRYAIERFPESKRKKLLLSTREGKKPRTR